MQTKTPIQDIRRAIRAFLEGKRVFLKHTQKSSTHVKMCGKKGFVCHKEGNEFTMIEQPIKKLVGFIYNHGKRGGIFMV